MKNFHLSWTGGNERAPTESKVRERLHAALLEGGVVTLDADDDLDRSRSLQVRAEMGRALLTFGWDDGTAWNVKVFVHPNSRSLAGSASIWGDVWLSRLIFEDSDVVVDSFLNFLNGREPSGEDWS